MVFGSFFLLLAKLFGFFWTSDVTDSSSRSFLGFPMEEEGSNWDDRDEEFIDGKLGKKLGFKEPADP